MRVAALYAMPGYFFQRHTHCRAAAATVDAIFTLLRARIEGARLLRARYNYFLSQRHAAICADTATVVYIHRPLSPAGLCYIHTCSLRHYATRAIIFICYATPSATPAADAARHWLPLLPAPKSCHTVFAAMLTPHAIRR